jgi:uncharacterized protein with NAD-binding domain and iron-sulfur cluster
VKPSSVRVLLLGGAMILAAMVTGCRGTGEVRPLDFRTKPPVVQITDMEPVRVVIEPFEDRRTDKSRVGMRSHLWGGTTYFNVQGDRATDVITQRLADRLKTRGWKDRMWNVRVVSAASVQDFSATVKSRVFSTVIDTSNRFTIQAKNLADQSTTIRTVEGGRSRTVFWFSEDDVQEQLSSTLKDGIDRLLSDTTIEQKTLRPVRYP